MLAALVALSLSAHAWAQDLSFGYRPSPKAGENPAVTITPARTVANLYVEITVGGKTLEFTRKAVAAGTPATFEWTRDTKVTHADVFVRASFADGDVEEQNVPIDYSFQTQLKVDLTGAAADIGAKTVTVKVAGVPKEAEVIAYGAHKAELEHTTVPVTVENGKVSVPFVGDPADVVLLDVTLKNDTAFAGFTYSPWFLNIPHEDVLFPTDSAEITPDQAYKLQATLEQLNDVVDKYGAIVPVKLYIAGCTDTMGDPTHNRDLSARRAYAIGKWLRANGFTYPIYTYGFGESLLSVQTGDEVDNQANRRALYMVGANPPPSGSGIPSVGWKAL